METIINVGEEDIYTGNSSRELRGSLIRIFSLRGSYRTITTVSGKERKVEEGLVVIIPVFLDLDEYSSALRRC